VLSNEFLSFIWKNVDVAGNMHACIYVKIKSLKLSLLISNDFKQCFDAFVDEALLLSEQITGSKICTQHQITQLHAMMLF